MRERIAERRGQPPLQEGQEEQVAERAQMARRTLLNEAEMEAEKAAEKAAAERNEGAQFDVDEIEAMVEAEIAKEAQAEEAIVKKIGGRTGR